MILTGIEQKIKMETYPYELKHEETSYRPIHYATEKKLIDELDYLVNTIKVNPNHQLNDGNTALHIACTIGNIKMVEILLNNKNINLDILNMNLKTPLFIAALNKYKKITEMLLNKGASFKIIKQGKTKKYEIDIYADINKKQEEYPEIIKLFNKYKISKKKLLKFKKLKKEYKYICDTLKNADIDDSIIILAENLGIKDIQNMKKNELCKKLGERIIIYAQNPDIIEEAIES
jgi:ankyrin repeat protein